MTINVVPGPAPRLTLHARRRMHSLGFTIRDVKNTITNPDWTRPNGPGHPPHCVVYVGSDLLVVLDPHIREVLTVLLRSNPPYEHGTHHRHHRPTAA